MKTGVRQGKRGAGGGGRGGVVDQKSERLRKKY